MTKFSSQFSIKINGQNAPEAMYDRLEEITVDTHLNLPGMFTIRLHDAQLEWVDNPLCEIGNPVQISVVVDEEDANEFSLKGSHSLIEGEITAIEPDFAANGKTRLLIRGYDKMHRLQRGRKTQTFLQVTDSVLVKRVAQECGLTPGKIDATSKTYDYVIQYNQTDMDFLMSRAERIGYQIFFYDGKINFVKGDRFPSEEGVKLTYLNNLTSFQPRWIANGQVDKFTAKGWDSIHKRPIVGSAKPNDSLNQGGMQKTGGDLTKEVFNSAEEIVVSRHVYDQTDANNVAAGLSNGTSRGFVQAEGECSGHPLVVAGCKVQIEGVGSRFKGNYLVTAAIHIYRAKGYQTRFSISSERSGTLTALLRDDRSASQEQGLVTGMVTGLVTNLNDPENLGRVKVKYAWLGEIESNWARVASPMAGAGRGWMFLPEVNDEVVIAFEHGDIHCPYIIGALWNLIDKPPKENNVVVKSGKVAERILKSRSGHLIILDDSDRNEKIIIRDKTNLNEIIIDSINNSIHINVDKELRSKSNGTIIIESAGKLILKSGADIAIDCQNFKVNAQSTVVLKGRTVNINDGALEVT
jgi:uncharacterized protein involved in type VI secretion and phage assembly